MIKGLYETHLNVLDLERSMHFYGELLGLELGLRGGPDRARADGHTAGTQRLAIYWIGGWGDAALGLWEKPAEQVVTQHFAFEIALADMDRAILDLQSKGIEVRDFFLKPTEQPTVFGWVPSASVYFEDPDGHLLEYLARLPGEPRPEVGTVTWDEWGRVAE